MDQPGIPGKEIRNSQGALHCLNGPAYTRLYSPGQLYYERYYVNGDSHRIGGPAFIQYYKHGQIQCIQYWVNNEKHRIDGPAEVWYFQNGKIASQEFCLHDVTFDIDIAMVSKFSKYKKESTIEKKIAHLLQINKNFYMHGIFFARGDLVLNLISQQIVLSERTRHRLELLISLT